MSQGYSLCLPSCPASSFAAGQTMTFFDDISRHLNEARMKLVRVLYYMKGIEPLGVSILFIQLDASFFFIRQVNRCDDRENVASVRRWLLCSGIPNLIIVADD